MSEPGDAELSRELVGESRVMRKLRARDPRRGAAAGHGAAHRGDRHRQGRRSARAARPLPAGAGSVRARRLRGALSTPDRERAVRPRAGSLHRGARSARGPLRAGGGGDGLPRRDRGARRAAAGEAAARAARPGIRAHRRRQHAVDDGARDRRHQPGSAARGARGALPRGSLLPARTSSSCGCRRCASDVATWPRWCARCFRGWRRRSASRPASSTARRSSRLAARSWPGNVRELMNVLERLLIRGAGRRIELADLEGIFDSEPWPLAGSGGCARVWVSRTAMPAAGPRRPRSGSPRCCGRTRATSPAPPASSACRAARCATACAGSVSPPVPRAASVAPADPEESDGAARGRRRLVCGAALLADLPRGGPRLGRAPRRRRHRLPGRAGHARPPAAHPPRALRDGDLPDPLVRDLALDAGLGEHAVRSRLGAGAPAPRRGDVGGGPCGERAAGACVRRSRSAIGMAAGVFQAPGVDRLRAPGGGELGRRRREPRRCCSRCSSR